MKSEIKYDLVTILGATATGKTTVAVALASKIDAEIISADSRQVYRRMDIGTGKDIEEYNYNGKNIPYHIIDIVDAGEKYNVFQYQNDFLKAYNNIKEQGGNAVLCGGTGMYLDAVTKGYKLIEVPDNIELRTKLEGKELSELKEILSTYKKMHNQSDVTDEKRAIRAIEIAEYYKNNPNIDTNYPKINNIFIGIEVDRDTRRKRITDRLKARLNEGMVDEVKALIDSGIKPEDLMYYGLEYKFITQYIIGELSYAQMVNSLQTAIHQFSKRQMTWFRGMERKGVKIHWINGLQPIDGKINEICELINS